MHIYVYIFLYNFFFKYFFYTNFLISLKTSPEAPIDLTIYAIKPNCSEIKQNTFFLGEEKNSEIKKNY